MPKQDFTRGMLVRVTKGPAIGAEGYIQARDQEQIQIATAMPKGSELSQGLWVLKEYVEAVA